MTDHVTRIVAVIALLTGSLAAAAELAPLEAYGKLPTYDMFELSPSGKLGASRVTVDGQDMVLVIDIDRNEFLTGANAEHVNPRWLRFVDDNQLILVAGETMRKLAVRNQFDFSQGFALDISTGEIQTLLRRAEYLHPYQSGLGRIVGKDPDSNNIYMPAFVKPRHGGGSPVNAVYRVDLGRKRAKVAVWGNQHTIDWFLDANGSPIAREDFNDEKNVHRIWAVSKDGDEKDLLYEEESELRTVSTVGVTAERDALVLLISTEDAGGWSYYLMSLADGAISGPVLATEGREIGRVITDINRVVYGVEYSGFKPSYAFFDEELHERVSAQQHRMADVASRLVSWSDDFQRLVFEIEGGWSSGAYVVFEKGELQPVMVGQSRPGIVGEQVVPVQITEYEARDGMTIPALVTAMNSVREAGPAPLVVLPHGGPESHDRYGFDWLAQFIASRGYVVLQPQFRGSDGFGHEHTVAGNGEWGGKMQSDLDDGVNFLIEQGIADPERVCMVGASYGGYAALAAGAFSPDMYRCVAAIAGVSDLRKMLQRKRSERGRDDWVLDYWEGLYGAGASDKEILRSISPAFHADAFKAPVLLIHGKKDTVVNIEQSKLMRKALRKAGKDVTYVELKGEDHWLTQEETRIETLQAVAAFIDKHL